MSNGIYPVNERFLTFQGEGINMGQAAFFIRLHGCPVHCPWCDSAGTWHKDFVPKDIHRMTAVALAQEAEVTGVNLAVITGGEPCIHDLNPLVDELLGISGMAVAIETCGAFPLPDNASHITVSPKWAKPPTVDALQTADEIKIIMDEPEAFDKWKQKLGGIWLGYDADETECWEAFQELMQSRGPAVWLHPEWSKRSDPDILRAIINYVKQFPTYLRAGYQMHKLYAADAEDKRARAPVPLGGDPAKGF